MYAFHTCCGVPGIQPIARGPALEYHMQEALAELRRRYDSPADIVRVAATAAIRSAGASTARSGQLDTIEDTAEDVAEQIADDFGIEPMPAPAPRPKKKPKRKPKRSTQCTRQLGKLKKQVEKLKAQWKKSKGTKEGAAIAKRHKRLLARYRKMKDRCRAGLQGYEDVEGLGFIKDIIDIFDGDDDGGGGSAAPPPFNPYGDPKVQRAEYMRQLNAQKHAEKLRRRAELHERKMQQSREYWEQRKAIQDAAQQAGVKPPFQLTGPTALAIGGVAALALMSFGRRRR